MAQVQELVGLAGLTVRPLVLLGVQGQRMVLAVQLKVLRAREQVMLLTVRMGLRKSALGVQARVRAEEAQHPMPALARLWKELLGPMVARVPSGAQALAH